MKPNLSRSLLFAAAIGLLLLVSVFVSQPYKGIFVTLYLVSGILFVAPRTREFASFRGIKISLARRSRRFRKQLLIGLFVSVAAVGWLPISFLLTPHASPDARVIISIIPALLLLFGGIIILSIGLIEAALCALGFFDRDSNSS